MSLLTLEKGGIDEICKFIGHTDRIGEAKFCNINDEDLCNAVISVSYDNTLKLWDKRSGEVVTSVNEPKNKSLFGVDNTDHQIIAGSEGSVLIYDLRKMKLLHNFTHLHSDDVTSVKFSKHSSNLILTAGEDYVGNLLDTINAELGDDFGEASYTCEQPLTKCDFISNTGLAYIISNVGTIEILNLETMLVSNSFSKDKGDHKIETIIGAQQIKDSVIFYMGNFKGEMFIYDQQFNFLEGIKTKQHLKVQENEESVVRDAFGVDDNTFIVGSDTGTIHKYQKLSGVLPQYEIPDSSFQMTEGEEAQIEEIGDELMQAKPSKKRFKYKPF